MPIVVIATAGAIDANSYATVAQGDLYHQTHLYGTTWENADTDQKGAALIWATRLLDEQISWNGTKSTSTQALRWPRTEVMDPDGYYFDGDIIPVWLQNATAELARYLLAEDRTAERGYGISKVKADVVEVEFDSADEKPILPASVRSMIGPYGSTGSEQGWVSLVRV